MATAKSWSRGWSRPRAFSDAKWAGSCACATHPKDFRFHLDTLLDEAIEMTRLLDRMSSEREE